MMLSASSQNLSPEMAAFLVGVFDRSFGATLPSRLYSRRR